MTPRQLAQPISGMGLEFKEISNQFLSDFDAVKTDTPIILERSDKMIKICRDALYLFKKKLLANEVSTTEEITFFKKTKQIVLEPLIYYSEVRSFELQLPKADAHSQKKFIKRKIAKLNRFFSNNLDFIQYAKYGYSHFDLQYYTRAFLDSFHIVSSKFYFQDPDFSTPRDMLLGKVKAYGLFVKYLQNRLIHTSANGTLTNGQASNLKWTSTKTALTELIYALHSNRIINNGNIDIKDIADALGELFHFDIGDFYKTYSEIKARKISRTKFLDDLSAGLLSQMDKSEI